MIFEITCFFYFFSSSRYSLPKQNKLNFNEFHCALNEWFAPNIRQLLHGITIKLVPNGSTLYRYKSDMHYLRGSVLLFHKYMDIMKMETNRSFKKERERKKRWRGKTQQKQNNTLSLSATQILRHTHKFKDKPTKEKKM